MIEMLGTGSVREGLWFTKAPRYMHFEDACDRFPMVFLTHSSRLRSGLNSRQSSMTVNKGLICRQTDMHGVRHRTEVYIR